MRERRRLQNCSLDREGMEEVGISGMSFSPALLYKHLNSYSHFWRSQVLVCLGPLSPALLAQCRQLRSMARDSLT